MPTVYKMYIYTLYIQYTYLLLYSIFIYNTIKIQEAHVRTFCYVNSDKTVVVLLHKRFNS